MTVRTLILALAALFIGSSAYAADDFDGAQPVIDPGIIADLGMSVMTADLEPMGDFPGADGKLVQREWYDETNAYESFRVDVVIPIPSEALGIHSLADAMDADVRVHVARHGYTVECLLAIEPVVSRSYVQFAVDLMAIWDEVKPQQGICDVDLYQPGIQVGMPVLHHRDYITSFVRSKPRGDYEFLEGYCE